MSILMAVNDGIVNNHWNEADVLFIVGAVLGALAAIAYAAGVGTVNRPEEPPDQPSDATTKTPVGPASTAPGYRQQQQWSWTTWHYRAHEIAAALLSLAVACVAFALFLQ